MSVNLPPHALEEEKAVIGCLTMQPDPCVDEAATALQAEAFYDLRHRELFACLVAMRDEGLGIDPLTIQRRLTAQPGTHWHSGVIEYIDQCQGAVASVAMLKDYLDIIREKWTLRRLIQACQGAVADAMGECEDVNGLVDRVERDILAVRVSAKKVTPTVRELVRDAVGIIQGWHESQGKISGIATGFMDLDRLTDGLRPGEMTVVAGFPGSGKTTLACQIAMHAAIDCKIPSAVFSLEMAAKLLVARLLCADARIDSWQVRAGNWTEEDQRRMMISVSKLAQSGMMFEELGDLSIYQLRSRARALWQQGMRLVVVDYLQLLNASGAAVRTDSRQEEVSVVSRGLKALAVELNVPVIALSQLNDDGRLRESRSIGQDADNVWRIESDNEADRNVRVAVTKQRNGPTGQVPLVFFKEFTRFESSAKVTEQDIPKTQHKRKGRYATDD